MRRVLGFLVTMLLLSGTVWGSGPDTKLARGLINAAFGWFEIVQAMTLESDRHGFFIGIPAGIFRGAIYGLGRTLNGIYETATFPLPNGKKGYDPLLLPESVFKPR